MASLVYNRAKKEIADGTINLISDTIKVMLVKSGYTPNADDDFIDFTGTSDPAGQEIVATNYTGGFGGAGRKTLANKAWTESDANDRAEFDADDVTWTSLGGASNDTIAAAILVKEITNDAASKLICYVDITDFTTNGGNFTLQWNSAGILNLT